MATEAYMQLPMARNRILPFLILFLVPIKTRETKVKKILKTPDLGGPGCARHGALVVAPRTAAVLLKFFQIKNKKNCGI